MMSIDRLSGPEVDLRSRYDTRGGGGQKDKGRFAVQRDKAEAPSETEGPSAHDKGGAARRRTMVRSGRKAGEAHDVHGQQHARRTKEVDALDLDWEEAGAEDEEQDDDEEDADDVARAGKASADFEVLTSQLLHLGPIREVTLNLPALGLVTARRNGDAVDLSIQVSRELLDAVRAGLDQMRDQLTAGGLAIGKVEITVRKASAPPPLWTEPTTPPARDPKDGRVLVDIMV